MSFPSGLFEISSHARQMKFNPLPNHVFFILVLRHIEQLSACFPIVKTDSIRQPVRL